MNIVKKLGVVITSLFLILNVTTSSFADGHAKKYYSALKDLVQETLFGLQLKKVLKKKQKN